MTERVLTMIDLVLLEAVISTCEGNAKVARLVNDNVVYGIARHVVRDPDSAAFLTSKDDVRDAYLRVTSREGFEYFWPIGELVEDQARGQFCRYDW